MQTVLLAGSYVVFLFRALFHCVSAPFRIVLEYPAIEMSRLHWKQLNYNIECGLIIHEFVCLKFRSIKDRWFLSMTLGIRDVEGYRNQRIVGFHEASYLIFLLNACFMILKGGKTI